MNLSPQLINQIMSYIGTKPYQEVFQIIEAVQKELQAQQVAQVQQPPQGE